MTNVEHSATATPGPTRVLSFVSGHEHYCVDILAVREIVTTLPITPIPRIDPVVLGLSNLRGRMLPMFDFGLASGTRAAPSESACVIVIDVFGVDVGLVVDEVASVVDPGQSDIRDVPDVPTKIDRSFLRGIVDLDGRPHLILAIQQLVAATGLVRTET